MYLARLLKLDNLLNKKSLFLFGPRATGKSSLIKHQFKDILVIDLLESDLYFRLTESPQLLEQIIKSHHDPKRVVIDEVQRIPMLLNEVHRLIESSQIHFLLTGSSARSLKQKHVNLLAGRAWETNLFPLVSHEIPQFDLSRYLRFGGLPAVYLSNTPYEELIAYVNTYLQQEILAEALVRKIPAFSKFLKAAAIMNGKLLNYSAIASDTGVTAATITEYYQILEDTFLGFTLSPWQKTQKRKTTSTGKFYFFDLGVCNTLRQINNIEPNTELYGDAFEHFIALELRAYISYKRLHLALNFWRTQYGYEVDFIVGDQYAIEAKATDKVKNKHLTALKALAEEKICRQYILVSHDKINRQTDNIKIIYWQDFLKALWNDEIIQSIP